MLQVYTDPNGARACIYPGPHASGLIKPFDRLTLGLIRGSSQKCYVTIACSWSSSHGSNTTILV